MGVVGTIGIGMMGVVGTTGIGAMGVMGAMGMTGDAMTRMRGNGGVTVVTCHLHGACCCVVTCYNTYRVSLASSSSSHHVRTSSTLPPNHTHHLPPHTHTYPSPPSPSPRRSEADWQETPTHRRDAGNQTPLRGSQSSYRPPSSSNRTLTSSWEYASSTATLPTARPGTGKGVVCVVYVWVLGVCMGAWCMYGCVFSLSLTVKCGCLGICGSVSVVVWDMWLVFLCVFGSVYTYIVCHHVVP